MHKVASRSLENNMPKRYWLMKSEPPHTRSTIERDKTTLWEGVRNYQARNLMKEMKVGDDVSSIIQREHGLQASPRLRCRRADPTQFNANDTTLIRRLRRPIQSALRSSEFKQKFVREVAFQS